MVWSLPELPMSWEALPCPLDAGWALIRLWELPKQADNGLSLGGFSAAAYQASDDRLWLVSDASRGYLLPVGPLAKALRTGGQLQVGPRLVLRDKNGTPLPPSLDAEGLALTGDHGVWIVSEGRRRAGHQARLQRFSLRDGRLLETTPLPPAWKALGGQGLAVNQGPESLTRSIDGGLLLAAEAPLLQDRAPSDRDSVRLAHLDPEGVMQEHGRVPLDSISEDPEETIGLTELLALDGPSALLALIRRHRPLQWTASLQLFSWPERASQLTLQPLKGWDLTRDEVPPDNWEGLAWGPELNDGRRTLVIVSDDNFSLIQRNLVGVLAPRRSPNCRSLPGHSVSVVWSRPGTSAAAAMSPSPRIINAGQSAAASRSSLAY